MIDAKNFFAETGCDDGNVKVLVFLLLLSTVPILGYQFGSGNQLEQFSLIARVINPDFAAGDFYIDAAIGFGPRFYYSTFIAPFVSLSSFPVTIFIMSLLVNFATGITTYFSAKKLLGLSVLASAAAAILAVANSSFALGWAGYIRFDSFQPASIALPVCLAAILLLYQSRVFLAAVLFAAASLFHPLIGVETGLLGFGSYFLATFFRNPFDTGKIQELLKQVGAGLVFLALVFIAWGVPSMLTNAEKIPDEEFFSLLVSFRSPHHYLASTFPATHFITLLFFCIAAAVLVWQFAKNKGLNRNAIGLIILATTVLLLCAFSYLFVDILESRVYATAQIFRMLYLVKWVGFLFAGWAVGHWFERHGIVGLILGILAIAVAGEAHGRALAFIVLLGLAAEAKFFSKNEMRKWILALAGSAGAIYFHNDLGFATDTMRVLAAAGVMFLLFLMPLERRLAMAASFAAITILMVFVWVNKSERWIDIYAFNPTFAWSDLQGSDVEIAQWARTNTPEGSIWATPPSFENFRVVAERAIIIDHTSIPFADMAQREWKERIDALYGPIEQSGFRALAEMGENYRSIDEDELQAAMTQYGAEYAVVYNETPWRGPVLYQNETFKAVQRQ